MKCLITDDIRTGFLRSRWMAVWLVSCRRRCIFLKEPPVIHWQEGWVCSRPDLAKSFTSCVKPVAQKNESRYPLNRRLSGSQTPSGCCGNSFLASAENLLSISRSSTLHPFQLDLPISIPYFEYLTMVYANTEGLQPHGTSRNLRLSRGEESVNLWSATS